MVNMLKLALNSKYRCAQVHPHRAANTAVDRLILLKLQRQNE